MFGFTKQDFTINSIIFLVVGFQGGVIILTGGSWITGGFLIFMALINLDAHYDFAYITWIMAQIWNKVNPDKLKKFIHWRYWEEFKDFDLIRKPDFDKPKIPKFIKKSVELSLLFTFENIKERLEHGKKVKTPLFEAEKEDASTG